MKAKNTNFIDYVKIFCRSGKGGAGSTHFHRSKTTSKGGPDGGDGGNGGNIILSCLLYTSPSPRDATLSRMPSSA